MKNLLFAILIALLVAPGAWAKTVWHVGSDGKVTKVNTVLPGKHKRPTVKPVITSKPPVAVKSLTTPAPASGVKFEVYFEDLICQNKIGFADPVKGADRRACVQRVVDYLGTVIHNTGTCEIYFLSSWNSTRMGVLSSGGTYFENLPGYSNGNAYHHITTGVDPEPYINDIEITVNFGYNWYSGDATPPSGQYDLYSVLLHEITHGLGVQSLMTSTGASTLAPTKAYSNWDRLMTTVTGNVPELSGNPPAFTGLATDLLGKRGGVYVNDPQIKAVYGNRIRVNTPLTFKVGTSLNHFAAGSSPPPVMLPSTGAAVMRRAYAPYELMLLRDLGYNVGE